MIQKLLENVCVYQLLGRIQVAGYSCVSFYLCVYMKNQFESIDLQIYLCSTKYKVIVKKI